MALSDRYRFEFTYGPIDMNEQYKFVKSPKCGAIHSFSGTIRDQDVDPAQPSSKVPIKGIYYEAYMSMLIKQLNEMLESVLSSDDADHDARLSVSLRLGFVPVGQSSIVICASSTGRDFSHKSIMKILNEIKLKAVIWKKLIYVDGRELWDSEIKSQAYWLDRSLAG